MSSLFANTKVHISSTEAKLDAENCFKNVTISSPTEEPRFESSDLHLLEVQAKLVNESPVALYSEVLHLRELLIAASLGERFVVQVGPCAEEGEDLQESRFLSRRLAFETLVRKVYGEHGLLVMRGLGQLAKSRSNLFDPRTGKPVYLGDLWNGANEEARELRFDHWPQLASEAARTANTLREQKEFFVSHEALALQYETPLLRISGTDRHLSSTHLPWLGARLFRSATHRSFLQQIQNPVGIKLSKDHRPEELAELLEYWTCKDINRPVVLIARLGVANVEDYFKTLFEHAAFCKTVSERKVLWFSDPLHGNTRLSSEGRKIRVVSEAIEELTRVHQNLARHGQRLSGLHLEATETAGNECLWTQSDSQEGLDESLCDPLLSLNQACRLLETAKTLIDSSSGLDASKSIR